jgi:tetratricopeptide (TPR) repeat protein
MHASLIYTSVHGFCKKNFHKKPVFFTISLRSPDISDKKGVFINPFYEAAMPGKIKFAVFLLIVSVTVTGSYIYSDTIYTKYLKFWHITVKKTSPSDVIDKAEADRRSFEKRLAKLTDKYDREKEESEYAAETGQYLSRMVRVFCGDDPETVPPSGRELAIYAGMFDMTHGDVLRGAGLIFKSVLRTLSNDEVVPFDRAITVLYDKEMFNDITLILSRVEYHHSESMLQMHAMSLYRTGRYAEADGKFSEYEKKGDPSARALYFHAMTLEKIRRINEAVTLAEKAHKLAPRDGEIRTLYVTLLNSAGRHKEAEKAGR